MISFKAFDCISPLRLTSFMVLSIAASSFAYANNGLMKKCENRVNNTPHKIQECVTQQGILKHLEKFQEIADSDPLNGRSSGNAGYNKSVDYIADQLRKAGYLVTLQPLDLPLTKVLTETVFQENSPSPQSYTRGEDYELILNGGSTGNMNVSGEVKRPLNNGCSVTDFAGFEGKVAMFGFLELGFDCGLNDKIANANANGAIALIIIEDEFPHPIAFTRVVPQPLPLLDISSEIGERYKTLIAQGTPPIVSIQTNYDNSVKKTYNVIAESKYGDPTNVIMAGAHLDTVGNAGIVDNGSGSAGVLEVALQLKKVKPKNKLRFAFWGAEEYGLLGSEAYVQGLVDSNKAQNVKLYLNADMIGSPNYGYFLSTPQDPELASPEVIAQSAVIAQSSINLLSQYGITGTIYEAAGASDDVSFNL